MKDYHNNKLPVIHLQKFQIFLNMQMMKVKYTNLLKEMYLKDEFLTLQTAKKFGVIKTDKSGALNPKKIY